MKNVSVIGIDISKLVFEILGVNRFGRHLFRKRVYRGEVMRTVEQFPRCMIALEACGGSHYWARRFERLGFTVKLIPPQFVKPYVKSNKNDRADAEAICEAALRPHMRFCSVKTVEQQEIQHLHRVREFAIKMRTALGNEIRGILAEYGVVLPKGRKALRGVWEEASRLQAEISRRGVEMVEDLLKEFWHINERVEKYDRELEALGKEHPVCKRLTTIPGVGPIIASAIVAAAPEPQLFRNGRGFAAWLGLVPRQHSTGGKEKLLGISKRGDTYIRKQLVHGARSILYHAHRKGDRLSVWANSVRERRGWNKAAVAVANKNARTIWALLRYEQDYRSPVSPAAAA